MKKLIALALLVPAVIIVVSKLRDDLVTVSPFTTTTADQMALLPTSTPIETATTAPKEEEQPAIPITTTPKTTTTRPEPKTAATSSEFVSLPVPFFWEIPDGVWVPPWSGACEEAAVMAVEGFYLKKPKEIVKREEAKELMFPLFGIENRLFGHNIDTDAKETAKLINEYTSFDAVVKDDPTLEEIKNEIRNGRPVISMHYGYGLQNPRHRFRAGGSSYHVMALVGFDDEKLEFLVNDSELQDGIDLRYKYDIILSTLHDFDHETKKADGPPRVVFTMPKLIAKNSNSGELYLIRDGKKFPIASPQVMENRRWSEDLITAMNQTTLDGMETGGIISN